MKTPRIFVSSLAAVALLGAMLWAAATDAAISLVGDGDLGGRPLAVAAAAGLAVVLEYGPRRARAGDWHRSCRARRAARGCATLR